MTTETISKHMADCKQVASIIENANALLMKSQKQLAQARDTLEKLREFQHPKMVMQVPYAFQRGGNRDESATPAVVIDRQIAEINSLLGDRA